MLPDLEGPPIRIRIRRSLGPHLAATSIPRRLILLDAAVLRMRGDFERILIHELFHFAWVRLSNMRRWSWEEILMCEFAQCVPGELGWSSEWRKNKLAPLDLRRRSPAWRRYACESFCDTAAWRFAGLENHEEFTLGMQHRGPRLAWFQKHLEPRNLLV